MKEKKKKKATLPQRILMVFLTLVLIAGIGILLYPAVSNQWHTFRQSRLIASYNKAVSEEQEETQDFSAYWEQAAAYNRTLTGASIYQDVFADEDNGTSSEEDSLYWSALNLGGDGIMGYLSIPKINVRLAIYHGRSEEVLQEGVGHLETSDLPIGGEGNHTVLAGHRGLPKARLFTDLDKLDIGDEFYLYILDEVLAYEVDQILPMVEKDDYETLEAALQPVEGEDYVTLFTCTPYGINSHRLLVRGHRVPYEAEQEETPLNAVLQAIRDYYLLYALTGIAVVLVILLIVRGILHARDRRRGSEP